MPADRADGVRRLVADGFPARLGRADPPRRDAWFRACLTRLLQRDVRDFADIKGLHDMLNLMSLRGACASALLNMAEVSRATGITHSTRRRYLSLLEALFIVQPLPAWSVKLDKRLVKALKLHLIDAGLIAHFRGHADAAALALSPQQGPLLDTFVVRELRRQLRWAGTAGAAFHFRTAAGQEVDRVLETPNRRIVGIDIKVSASLHQGDFAGLRELRDAGWGLSQEASFCTPASSFCPSKTSCGQCLWVCCGWRVRRLHQPPWACRPGRCATFGPCWPTSRASCSTRLRLVSHWAVRRTTRPPATATP